MARVPTRREWTLMAALALVAVAVVYYGGDSRFGLGGSDEESKPVKIGDPPVVRMDRLMAESEAYDSEGRNLFKYYTPPAKAAPPPAPVQRAPQPDQKPIQRVATARPAPMAQAPKPPPIPFRYVGYLGPKDDKIAVFEEGVELLLARAGEVVRDRFLVVEFQYEKVVMGYTDPRFKNQTTELVMSNR